MAGIAVLAAVTLLPLGCRVPFAPPEAVRLIEPPADTSLGRATVSFVWDSVARAASYQIQVDDRSTFASPVLDSAGISERTLVVPLADGQYHWRVRARSAEMVWGNWSESARFQVRTYRVLGQVRTRGYAQELDMRGDHVYVADGQAGLSIYNVADPANPVLAGSIMDTLNTAYSVTVSGDYAYLAYGRKQIQIVDARRFDSLRLLGSIAYTTGYGYDIKVMDTNYAFVVTRGRMTVIDVVNPNFPQVISEPRATGRGIWIADSTAYAACEQVGLLIYRVPVPNPPIALGGTRTMSNARDVAVQGRYAFVADGREGLTIVDVGDPASPTLVSSCRVPGGYANKVAVAGNLAYLAAGSAGLAVIDVSDRMQPSVIAVIDLPEAKAVLAAADGRVIVADRDFGLVILEKEE